MTVGVLMRINRIVPAAVALAAVVWVAAAGGCAPKAKKPTIKEKAEAQWNGARASVMISLAQDQYKSGNFEKARQTVDDAIKLVPESAEVTEVVEVEAPTSQPAEAEVVEVEAEVDAEGDALEGTTLTELEVSEGK